MAIHKKDAFIQKEQDLAEFAKALAHPARIAILKVLAQRNECICGELVDVLPLAQSTVSQHLKELKKSRTDHRHGRRAKKLLLHQLEGF